VNLNLNELEAAVGKMTPGPWTNEVADWHVHNDDCDDLVAVCDCMNDAQGIVALRNAAPELIAAVKQRDELAALLRRVLDSEGVHLGVRLADDADAALAKVGP
jgi:hypothetical protein